MTVLGDLQDLKVGCDELQAWQEQIKADFNLHMFLGDLSSTFCPISFTRKVS